MPASGFAAGFLVMELICANGKRNPGRNLLVTEF